MALGMDVEGEPIALPEQATRWRVRRSPARGPAVTIPGYDGTPLTIPIESEPDDIAEILAELGENKPGRYRLDAVDDTGRAVLDKSTCAYWTLPGSQQNGPADVHSSLANTLASNERLCKTMADAMTSIAKQLAPIMEASSKASAVHAANSPAVQVIAAADRDDDEPPRNTVDWTPLVESCAPILAKLGELAAMKAITAASAPKLATGDKPTA